MNQQLPTSNVKELAKPVAEQFFVLRGSKEPWIDGDLYSRAAVIKEIDADYSNLRQIIAISLAAGTCRDATDEICKVVINRWVEDNEFLTPKSYEFVEMVCGKSFADAFQMEDE